MPNARSHPRGGVASLITGALAALVMAGCAGGPDLTTDVLKLQADTVDLRKRLDPIEGRIESLRNGIEDLRARVIDLDAKLGQARLDLEMFRKHSPALARFESAQEREARLNELLGKLDSADDAAWLDVREGFQRVGAAAVAPLLARYATGDALALRRVPEVLRSLVDPAAVTPLAAGLEQTATRALAAEALGLLGNPEGVPWLRTHLADASPSVRHAVAVALGRLKDLAGVPELLAELAAEEFDVRLIAIRELQALTGQDFGYSAHEKDATRRQQAVDRARAWYEAQGAPAKPPADEGGDAPDGTTKGAER